MGPRAPVPSCAEPKSTILECAGVALARRRADFRDQRVVCQGADSGARTGRSFIRRLASLAKECYAHFRDTGRNA
jgi:hypothetical protein